MTPARPSVLEIALRPPQRSEKAEERLCDDFIARLGGDIVRRSQPRHTMQTLGIPDRRYRVTGVAFDWEVKAGKGRLSAEQKAYLGAELCYGEACGCGDFEDLYQFVSAFSRVPCNTFPRVIGGGGGPFVGFSVPERRDYALCLAPALIAKWERKGRPAARGKIRRKRAGAQ